MENLPTTTTQSNFFSDARNWAKTTTGTLLLGGAGLLFFYKILPFLTKLVWDGVTLAVGLGVLGILIMVLTSSKFWRNVGYINAIIAKMFTFWIISWDDFIIQEQEIERAEKDREVILAQSKVLYGQISEKETELAEAKAKQADALAMKKQLDIENVPETDPEYQFQVAEWSRQKDFYDTIAPMKQEIENLAKMLDEVYKQTGFKIKDARAELAVQKTKLKSYTAGETAMGKAYRTLVGDLGLSKDADIARQAVKAKIASKIGGIKSTLDIIAPIIRERKLQDRSKVTLALEQMKNLQIDGQTIHVQLPQTLLSNQYANLIKK